MVALLAGNAALAEVTPEEVWEDWKGLLSASGQTLTTESESRAGDTFVVTGLKVTADQDGAKSEISIPDLSFRDTGDGSVEVRMSDTIPVMLSSPPAEGEDGPTGIGLEVGQPGLTILASGSAEETRYDIDAPTVTIKVTEVDGVAAADINLVFEVTASDTTGSYTIAGATDKTISSSMNTANVTLNAAFTDPEAGGTFKIAGAMSDLAGTSNSTLLGSMDMTDMAAALKAGFAMDGAFTYGKTDFTFDFAEGEQTGSGKGSVEGGNLAVKMDKTQLAYGGGAKGVAITVASSDMPFPELNLGYADSAFNFVMPVAKSEEPADFALLTRIVDLTISDEVWSMFDPTAQLPRDPVTFVLDTKGKAKLTTDLMDTAAMEALGEGAPGELHALDLTELRLKAVGAEVTGTGALTFDNTDLVTYQGMPKPTGSVELKAVGLNGLLDKVTAMGLVPEDQVMGVRMMMGMFAKMVDGEPDTMTSTLEFKPEGFFANGMQLQ